MAAKIARTPSVQTVVGPSTVAPRVLITAPVPLTTASTGPGCSKVPTTAVSRSCRPSLRAESSLRTSTRTSCPAARAWVTTCRPVRPVPPNTAIRIILSS